MAYMELGAKADGSIVKLNENGVPIEFFVSKQNYESGLNGSGRVLVVRKALYDKRKWSNDSVVEYSQTANKKTYGESSIDTWLNGDYKTMLDPDIQAVMGTTKFYSCKAKAGQNKKYDLEIISRSVFLLSAEELGNTYNIEKDPRGEEGECLSIAYALRLGHLGGAPETQWTRTMEGRVINVYDLDSSGNATQTFYVWTVLGVAASATGTIATYPAMNEMGSRPAFTLPSSLLVSDDGTVTTNAPPSISGNIPNNTNLGTKNEGFEFTYTVEDADGDQVTVREYLDNTLKRTYAATAGESNTFQAVADANWQRVLNGEHTLKVVANDGKEDSEAYAVTFTKAVYSAGVTLETPMEADDQIRVMVMALVGSVPADAELEVLVTNNAKDDEPVWEDATGDVKTGTNHVFANQTAANGFAFNFKLTVSRGENGQGGYLTSIGGAFE